MRRGFLTLLGTVIFLQFLAARPLQAETQKGQFQLGTGFGVFVGSEGLGPSFDIDLEPEYFVTKHFSLSGRFDGTVGGTDSVHFGMRFLYYFNFPQHNRFDVYVGGGAGAIVAFDGGTSGLGDFALPVFGFQYELSKHVRLGSDFSFDVVFNGNTAAFATRIMPLQFKWVF